MATSQLSDELERILEQEYQALLSGSLTEIEKLVAEKTSFLERISHFKPREMDAFVPLRDKLFRNQKLGQSAVDGMRKAVSRAKEVTDVSMGLRTYGPDGKKSCVTARTSRTLSKRR